MKVIKYFNLEMVVADKFKWISYDEAGEIQLFENKPVVTNEENQGEGYFVDDLDDTIHLLGNRISFIDAKDWKLSLREI